MIAIEGTSCSSNVVFLGERLIRRGDVKGALQLYLEARDDLKGKWLSRDNAALVTQTIRLIYELRDCKKGDAVTCQ